MRINISKQSFYIFKAFTFNYAKNIFYFAKVGVRIKFGGKTVKLYSEIFTVGDYIQWMDAQPKKWLSYNLSFNKFQEVN